MNGSKKGVAHGILSAAVFTLGIQIVGLVLQYVSQLLAARMCGSDAEFGIFGQSRSWVQLLGTLAAWGLPTIALRFVPGFLQNQEYGSIGALLRYGYWKISLFSVGAVLFGAVFVLLSRRADFGAWVLAIGMMGIPLCATHLMQMQATRSLERIGWTFLPYFLFQPLVFLGVVGLAWSLGWTIQSGWLVAAYVVSLAITNLLQFYPLYAFLPSETQNGRSTLQQRKEWNSIANDLGLSTSAALFLRESDVIFVGLLAGDAAAGIYMAATRIARLASFALNASSAMVGPKIAVRFRQGKIQELEHLVQFSTIMSTIATVAIGLGLVFLAGPLLRMFGSGYEAGQSLVVILLVGHMVNSATGPCGQVLALTGHQRIASKLYIIASGVHLIGNIVGILLWGTIGGAIATSSVLAICNLAMAYLVYRLVGISIIPGRKRMKADDTPSST